MSEESKGGAARNMTRCKLVRGASVPAIYVLCGGSPAAAASLTCRAKAFADQATGGYPAVGLPITSGSWLAVQAYKDGAGDYYVRGPEMAALTTAMGSKQTPYLASTDCHNVTKNTIHAISSKTLTLQSGKSIAVKVNSLGKIVGCSSTSSSGSAIMSMGCWSSVVGP